MAMRCHTPLRLLRLSHWPFASLRSILRQLPLAVVLSTVLIQPPVICHLLPPSHAPTSTCMTCTTTSGGHERQLRQESAMPCAAAADYEQPTTSSDTRHAWVRPAMRSNHATVSSSSSHESMAGHEQHQHPRQPEAEARDTADARDTAAAGHQLFGRHSCATTTTATATANVARLLPAGGRCWRSS